MSSMCSCAPVRVPCVSRALPPVSFCDRLPILPELDLSYSTVLYVLYVPDRVPCVSRLPPLVVPDRERFTILCARRRPPALIDKQALADPARAADRLS